MDEEYEVGGFNLRGKRRLSEEMIMMKDADDLKGRKNNKIVETDGDMRFYTVNKVR
jgi:hypothetical protein